MSEPSFFSYITNLFQLCSCSSRGTTSAVINPTFLDKDSFEQVLSLEPVKESVDESVKESVKESVAILESVKESDISLEPDARLEGDTGFTEEKESTWSFFF